MKRALALILSVLLFCSCLAKAETSLGSINLHDLSFENLRTLDYWIAEEMASRPEWKNVTVPPGAYEIGVDIPSRWWDITLTDKENGYVAIYYGKQLDRSSTQIEWNSMIYYGYLTEDQPTISIYLEKYNYIVINHESVIFTPHVQPTLGF